MYDTPKGLRLHIGLFGRRNVGKSSLLNALTQQDVAIVSATPGTTTDPVEKVLELAPVGPVVFLDTAGLDDSGELGRQRVERSLRAMERADLVLLILGENGWGSLEEHVLAQLEQRHLPCCIVQNKADLLPYDTALERQLQKRRLPLLHVSAHSGQGLETLRQLIAQLAPGHILHQQPLANLLPRESLVLLVTPLDSGAPQGRLILPQVQTIRSALDEQHICVVVTEKQLLPALRRLKMLPDLIVCDSQVIQRVAAETPPQVRLTTFSILMARLKSDLEELARGAAILHLLRPGDAILIQEACSHHPQKDDIGRIKIPRLLRQHAGGPLDIDVVAGKEFTTPNKPYKLAIHCGGCTITPAQMQRRLRAARMAGIPMTNYGMVISAVQGLLERVLEPFPQAARAYAQATGHRTEPDTAPKEVATAQQPFPEEE